jgi:hypothetical protein
MKEMAREIGVSVTAAKGRLHHAKMALRKSNTLRSIKDRDRLLAIAVRSRRSDKCRRRDGGSCFKSTSTTTLNNLRPSVTFHRRQATLEAK